MRLLFPRSILLNVWVISHRNLTCESHNRMQHIQLSTGSLWRELRDGLVFGKCGVAGVTHHLTMTNHRHRHYPRWLSLTAGISQASMLEDRRRWYGVTVVAKYTAPVSINEVRRINFRVTGDNVRHCSHMHASLTIPSAIGTDGP